MFTFELYIFLTLGSVLVISILLTNKYKARMNHMSGMVMSMFQGMNIGLTSGIFFGTLHQGDLYYSTLLGIVIGSLCGLLCCFRMGVSPSAEGFMAGIMGGMMGAMLGEMIAPPQSLVFMNIFLTLSVCSLLLYKILPDSTGSFISAAEILKAALLFLMVSSYLIGGAQLGKHWIKDLHGNSGIQKQHYNEKQHNH